MGGVVVVFGLPPPQADWNTQPAEMNSIAANIISLLRFCFGSRIVPNTVAGNRNHIA